MNRSLARLVRRLAGIGSGPELDRVLEEAASAAREMRASPELRALLEGLGGLFARIDAAYDQHDRDLDLRTRSLELTSAELVGANERLREDLATRNRVLEALREAAATLLGAGSDAQAVPEATDVEGLSALLPALVRQQEASRTALAESERKFVDLYENAPVMLQASDAEGVLTSVNAYWLAQLGYRREEVIGRRLTEFMTPESRRHALEVVEPGFRRTGFFRDAAYELRKQDGSVIDVLLTAYAEGGAEGGAARSLAAMVDVTQRKRVQRLQAALNEISEAAHSEAGLADMLGRIHGIIGELLPARNFFVALLDEERATVSFPYFVDEHDSTPAPRRLGEGGLTEEVLRTGEALLLTPQSAHSATRHGQPVFGTDSLDWLGVPLKTEARTIGVLAVQSYGGAVRYGEGDLALLKFVSGQVAAAIERKRAEEALQLAALVYEHSSEAMMVSDAENRIIAINPAFTELTGYEAQEVIGRNPRVLKSGRQDPDFYRAMWESLAREGRWQGEIWNRHRNGRLFAEELSINTIRHRDGSVHRYVALFSDVTEKKQAEALIWQQANFDSLTHLPNRRTFRDRLDQNLKSCRRNGTSLALLFIDLDRFKEVNDTLGHDNGDLLLVEAARRIRACVRESDSVARLGGDEFTVALPELEDAGRVQYIAQKIIDSLSEDFALGQEKVFITASIGITLYPSDATEIEDLFKHADQALYVAKAEGRGRFSYFTPELQVAAQARMRLTNDLRVALEQGQFSLHFQPVVELATGRVRKAEALIRWQHPQRGTISPAQFIPLAEASGLIVDIGAWTFREATRWVGRWRAAGHGEFQVSINQSPREFQAYGHRYSEWVAHLARAGLPGDCLAVEITEGLLLDASDEVKAKLLELSDAGIEVALDDFGVGYSSLSYLKNLDIDYLKIDQSFTSNLAPGSSDMALSEAIIVMAHKLGLRVVAEGVETEEQRELLRAAGCDFAQGYLFAEPVPAEEFETFLLGRPRTASAGE